MYKKKNKNNQFSKQQYIPNTNIKYDGLLAENEILKDWDRLCRNKMKGNKINNTKLKHGWVLNTKCIVKIIKKSFIIGNFFL